jgi:hypothetical protein
MSLRAPLVGLLHQKEKKSGGRAGAGAGGAESRQDHRPRITPTSIAGFSNVDSRNFRLLVVCALRFSSTSR